jgi:hypothetical protein
MSDLPKLSICLATYKRTEEALRTIRSTCDNLGYPKELRSWFIADDGSPKEHHEAILSLLEEKGENILGHHNERFRHPGREDTHSCGIGWNRGLGICHQNSDFVLWEEDDWELEHPLDLIPYVNLLQNREDVGICSFRILSVGADVHTVGFEGRHYLKYLRTTQYAYSGNPHLRHARYTRRYGWFAEDRNPGLIELHMDDQYRLATENLIDIWRPLDISVWGGWAHIGSTKTWE